jgi:hypothetical protein
MTNHVVRLYLLALALLLFFALWASIAAHPWAAAAPDPRAAALDRREASVRAQAARTEMLLAAKWSEYRVALRERKALLASVATPAPAAPPPPPIVHVTTLPPITTTRSS